MTPADNRRRWVLEALDQYEVRLFRYALRILGDHDLARDAVQHALLRLCDYGPERIGGPVAAWLFRVCRNRAIDHLRKAGREQSLDESAPPEAAGVNRLSDRDDDPAHVAQARELVARLRTLIDALPPAQREAIDLWCEGFAYREISEIVGRQEGNIRVLVHRGLARLRESAEVRRWLNEETNPAVRLQPLPPQTTAR
jgi:RNA polymerase sigma-70 factor (ECF subfamily)